MTLFCFLDQEGGGSDNISGRSRKKENTDFGVDRSAVEGGKIEVEQREAIIECKKNKNEWIMYPPLMAEPMRPKRASGKVGSVVWILAGV